MTGRPVVGSMIGMPVTGSMAGRWMSWKASDSAVERVGWFFDSAGGDIAVLGNESRAVELPHRSGTQPHQSFVMLSVDCRHRREQLGIDDRADLAAGVVEHAVGVHRAIALAEHNVAFHVDFQRQVALLRGAGGVDARQAPDHDAVGFDVDVAQRPERFRQPFDAEALDHDDHAALQHKNVFTVGTPFDVEAWLDARATRKKLDAAEVGPVLRRGWRQAAPAPARFAGRGAAAARIGPAARRGRRSAGA